MTVRRKGIGDGVGWRRLVKNNVSTLRRWVRRFEDGELGQTDLSDKTQRTDFKNYCSVGGSVLKCVVIL